MEYDYNKREETVKFEWHGLEVDASLYIETYPSGSEFVECQGIGPMGLEGKSIPDDLLLFLAEAHDKELGRLAVEKYRGVVGS